MALMPEYAPLARLAAEAGRGLEFTDGAAGRLRPRLLALGALPPARQVLELQAILIDLAGCGRRPVASGEIPLSENPRDRERMQRVLTFLHANYDRPLRLAPLSAIAHLTDSQLQRVFKRSTRMSISQYVTQLRIGKACQLLVQTDLPMSHIAAESGFSDPAHLARQFRAAKGLPPTRYRENFKHARAGGGAE
jgi:AraC-like DNA-binding protein